MTISIAILNLKGGVGKTTTTLNLGHALAIKGKKVLLLDFDRQVNLTSVLLRDEDQPEFTTAELLLSQTSSSKGRELRERGIKVKDYIKEIKLDTKDQEHISFIPGSRYLMEVERELDNLPNREWALSKFFEFYEKDLREFDFILIDCPPSLGILSVNAFVGSRYLLTPVDSIEFSLDALNDTIQAMAEQNTTLNSFTEILGILHVRFAKNLKQHQLAEKYLRDEAGDRYIESRIRTDTKLQESPGEKQTIYEYAPQSRGAEDYMSLANEVLERTNEYA